MSIYDNKLWLSDLDEIIDAFLPEFNELAGKSIMITGCNGLICSAIVDLIIRWNEVHESHYTYNHDKIITILSAGRDKTKIERRFFPYSSKSWFNFTHYDALSTTLITCNHYCDYIIHGASNASPNKITQEPVETMISNIVGTKNILDYARSQNIKRVLYISSSEVYGLRETNDQSKHDDYGWIDILNSRSSYSIGKRAAETLCVSYAKEYNVETVIVRPGHIYGPTALETDNRVSSAWAYTVACGEDIIMKSDGKQLRSYCYCLDCASAILKVLLKGENATAYNISNPQSVITIKGMAEILANIAEVKLKMELPTEAEKRSFNPMSNSSLDSSKLLSLGWKGCFDAERGFQHTVKILKENMSKY